MARNSGIPVTISPDQAVGHGVRTVTGTVLAVMVVPALCAFALGTMLSGRELGLIQMEIVFAVCWPLAWLTWSILTPRWRLWAYQRVDDIDELKRLAVDANLVWPTGWIFERTEIMSRSMRDRLRELEAKAHNVADQKMEL